MRKLTLATDFRRCPFGNLLKKYDYSTYVSDNVTVPFAAKYDAHAVESNKYLKWETADLFQAERQFTEDNKTKTFSMILPPPNITGTLHLGHALTVTIQDILCRWKRMRGFAVLWVPGADHAGIATQVVVEKYLFGKTGLTRNDIGEDKFLQQVLLWKAGKMNKIIEQLRQLGASVDWSKFSYTMDAKQSFAVVEAVVKLHDEGLLYRGDGIVNWSCRLLSTISDTEIDYIEIEGPESLTVPGYDKPVKFGLLYDLALKSTDSGEEIIVSTTRPETVYGDVAIAVHPVDERYKHLAGKSLVHPFRDCPIPVVFDEQVDPHFGSGAVKITPAHDKTDFEISRRENLPAISLITEAGLMNEMCRECANMPRFHAREKVIELSKSAGILRAERPHRMRIPICNRSGDVVEQLLKPQWFLKSRDLAERAIRVVENGDLVVEPSQYVEPYLDWLRNTKDWCVSRQIWWGHKLPLYETDFGWVAASSVGAAREKAEKKFDRKCDNIRQENDVLDTWFSSSLLPFSVFRWPQMYPNFEKFYPLSLMETGADILHSWVTRMVMMGLYFTDDLPFKKVFLHGMVCDHKGRKMSKSLGNVIQPNYIIKGISLSALNDIARSNARAGLISETEMEKAFDFQERTFPNGVPACGADALRLTLTSFDLTGRILHFDSRQCEINLHFCNKLWQASKFVIGWATKYNFASASILKPVEPWHFWLLHRLHCCVLNANKSFEELNFCTATESLKHFLQNDFCDTFLEISKPILKSGPDEEAIATCSVMLYSLETYLRLLSPVMPFIADELYSYLPNCSQKIVGCCSYPRDEDLKRWENRILNEEMNFVREIVRCSRALIEVLGLKNSICDVVIVSEKEKAVNRYAHVIRSLTRCNSVTVSGSASAYVSGAVNPVGHEATVFVSLQNPTSFQMTANVNLLDAQISSLRRSFNSKIKRCEEMTDPKKIVIELLEEWNNLEIESHRLRENEKTISWDYVVEIATFLKNLRRVDNRLRVISDEKENVEKDS